MTTEYTTIHRHGILLFFMTAKYFVYLIPIGLLGWIFYRYQYLFHHDFSNFILLPILLITVNIIFIQLIMNAIDFFGRTMLISDHAIVLIHTSFILIDDIEFMDMKSILKVDVERHGLLANILNFGHILLEQRNDIRTVHYMPHPHAVYKVVKEKIPRKSDIASL